MLGSQRIRQDGLGGRVLRVCIGDGADGKSGRRFALKGKSDAPVSVVPSVLAPAVWKKHQILERQ